MSYKFRGKGSRRTFHSTTSPTTADFRRMQRFAITHPCRTGEEIGDLRFAMGFEGEELAVIVTVNCRDVDFEVFGGPVWMATAGSPLLTADEWEVWALAALDGVGDATLGEWREGPIEAPTFCIYRRLTPSEEAEASAAPERAS